LGVLPPANICSWALLNQKCCCKFLTNLQLLFIFFSSLGAGYCAGPKWRESRLFDMNESEKGGNLVKDDCGEFLSK